MRSGKLNFSLVRLREELLFFFLLLLLSMLEHFSLVTSSTGFSGGGRGRRRMVILHLHRRENCGMYRREIQSGLLYPTRPDPTRPVQNKEGRERKDPFGNPALSFRTAGRRTDGNVHFSSERTSFRDGYCATRFFDKLATCSSFTNLFCKWQKRTKKKGNSGNIS